MQSGSVKARKMGALEVVSQMRFDTSEDEGKEEDG